jgi:molecular chaperone HtpG
MLLYVPTRAPFDLWEHTASHGVKLYVRRVFIMDDATQLMPHYLRFARGVVDTNNLPLNVSREILQESKDIEAIRSGCTKKLLGLLEDMAGKDPEKYAKFWGVFGNVLKEGVGEDIANKDKIAGLMRLASTHTNSPETVVSLADYIGRMKEGQDKIYYITADTFNAAKNSPHLEVFRKKDIEVLLLTDRVDEWVVGNLPLFDGKPLVSVAKGGLDLGKLENEIDKKDQERDADTFKSLAEKIKASLGDRVKEVRVTNRLTDSPACLVVDVNDINANLARLLKASGQKAPVSQPILEINPRHPVVLRLDAEEDKFDDLASVLFDQALLAEGGQLDDPASFVKRINQLMLEMSGNKPNK